MIGTALLASAISLALMKAWGHRPSRRRLRRAQRQLGRLAPPMRRALPGAAAPPWYREVPMPRPLVSRKD